MYRYTCRVRKSLPIAVIGAGPVGLSAAAHIVERGETPILLEMSDGIAGNIRSWEHVRVFTRWADNIDNAARRLLEASGWVAPDEDALPTGKEIVGLYLDPLAKLPSIAPHLHLGMRVTAVGRLNIDKVQESSRDDAPFVLQVVNGHGVESQVEARAVIDASGTWSNPNPIGAGGLSARGERAAVDQIYYGIPDVSGAQRHRYADRRVMVVGGGHSAFQALLDLGRLRALHPATSVYWVLRHPVRPSTFGGGSNDELPARGKLGQRLERMIRDGGLTVLAPFRIEEIEQIGGVLLVTGSAEKDDTSTVEVDEIIAVTGSRPDLGILREVRIQIDPAIEGVSAIAPLIDPNFHTCGTVPPHGEAELRHPEKDFYIVGNKSYGRAPTFLMMTGYEQVRSVVAALAGDIDAARRVELVLPDTGVDLSNDDAVYDLGTVSQGS